MADFIDAYGKFTDGLQKYSELRDTIETAYNGERKDFSGLDGDELVEEFDDADLEAVDTIASYWGRALQLHNDDEVAVARKGIKQSVDSEWKKKWCQNAVIEEDYETAAALSSYDVGELEEEFSDERELFRQKREEYGMPGPNGDEWTKEEYREIMRIGDAAEGLGLDIDAGYDKIIETLR